jgi:hypothetical protein
MARLFPSNPIGPIEVAFGTPGGTGTAFFTVNNGSGSPPPTVEIWERTIPWTPPVPPPPAPPPPPPPPFAPGGTFPNPTTVTNLTSVTRPVPLGGLYQVRLYRLGQGRSDGEGPVLGKLDFPCINPELRQNILTQCADVPQLDGSTGGTFVSMAFATSVPSMARAQLGAAQPDVIASGGVLAGPALSTPPAVVASAVSEGGSKRLHKMTLIDKLLQPDTELHAPLLPGNALFFVVLAWNAEGSWDFVWNTTGIAPATSPETVMTKRRAVSVRLSKLHVFDDSDDLSDGEGEFKLVVTRDSGVSVNTQSFSTSFETGQTVSVPPNMQFNSGLEVITPANRQILVRVDGHEDDTGSFPPDDDDYASAPLGFTGGQPLVFPVGEGKEEADNELLALPSVPHAVGGKLSFLAELRISVKYNP